MNRLEKIQMAIDKGITCDPETGKVFGVKGKEITYEDAYGYVMIRFMFKRKGYSLKAHQFIWYCVNQEIVEEIDHIDRKRNNNSIYNLRACNRKLNAKNINCKGFHFCNRLKKYVSKITIDGKSNYLGSYKSKEEARQAYLQAKKKYFPNL